MIKTGKVVLSTQGCPLLTIFVKVLLLFLLASGLVFISCAGHKDLQLRFHGRFLYDRLERSELPWEVWAKSVEGKNIYLYEIGEGKPVTVIFGGFHGSEPLSSELAFQFAEYLYNEFHNKINSKVVIVPAVNPDGLVRSQWTNANGVDLNRNFPTQNWTSEFEKENQNPGEYPASEPETRAIIELIEKYQPDRIISIHTPLRKVNYDGPAKDLALLMSKFNHYPISADIGYPTPGSFGTYTGDEGNIPTVTLELPKVSFQKIWDQNLEALLAVIQYY